MGQWKDPKTLKTAWPGLVTVTPGTAAVAPKSHLYVKIDCGKSQYQTTDSIKLQTGELLCPVLTFVFISSLYLETLYRLKTLYTKTFQSVTLPMLNAESFKKKIHPSKSP